MQPAQSGDTVKIHFTGKTKEGDVFASSQGDQPLEFTIGDGHLLPGIEKAVQGMKKGEHKTVTLNPEDGYGHRHDELILNVERSEFPQDFTPQVGMHLQVPQPDGTFVVFQVLSVSDKSVRLDANHPLAGQTLTFDIDLVEITD